MRTAKRKKSALVREYEKERDALRKRVERLRKSGISIPKGIIPAKPKRVRQESIERLRKLTRDKLLKIGTKEKVTENLEKVRKKEAERRQKISTRAKERENLKKEIRRKEQQIPGGFARTRAEGESLKDYNDYLDSVIDELEEITEPETGIVEPPKFDYDEIEYEGDEFEEPEPEEIPEPETEYETPRFEYDIDNSVFTDLETGEIIEPSDIAFYSGGADMIIDLFRKSYAGLDSVLIDIMDDLLDQMIEKEGYKKVAEIIGDHWETLSDAMERGVFYMTGGEYMRAPGIIIRALKESFGPHVSAVFSASFNSYFNAVLDNIFGEGNIED